MLQRPARGLFIVGTDTEVGKTFVASLILKALRRDNHSVGVYKPVASGCIKEEGAVVSTDATTLWEAAGCPQKLSDVTPQCFLAPLAPPTAARQEGRQVDAELLRTGLEAWAEAPMVIVEGVGGILSPISDDDLVLDLIVDFGYPIVVVVPNCLGSINQTLLTLLAAEQSFLSVAGMIINHPQANTDESSLSNVEEIRKRTNVPVLAQIGYGDTELDCDPSGWM